MCQFTFQTSICTLLVFKVIFPLTTLKCEDDSNILKRCCGALTIYAITLLEYLYRTISKQPFNSVVPQVFIVVILQLCFEHISEMLQIFHCFALICCFKTLRGSYTYQKPYNFVYRANTYILFLKNKKTYGCFTLTKNKGLLIYQFLQLFSFNYKNHAL